jgi:hypothetical protein
MPKYQAYDTLSYAKLLLGIICLAYLYFTFEEGRAHGAATRLTRINFGKRCLEYEEVRALNPHLCEQSQSISYWFAEETGFKHVGTVLYSKLESAGWFTVSVVVAGFIISYLMMQVASAGQRMQEVATMIRRQSSGVRIEEVEDGYEDFRRPRITH